MITNALNEVLHGIDLEEFRTRVGSEREEADQLLDQVRDLIDRLAMGGDWSDRDGDDE